MSYLFQVNHKISISNYNVQFGASYGEPIEAGLKLILKELQRAPITENKLKGAVVYTFRCEADGIIRWIGAGESDLLADHQNELKNELIVHLMRNQVRFPEPGEVTKLEVKIKFEKAACNSK